MPKSSPIKTSFNAGELSPLIEGRVDIGKYANGCSLMENMIPSVQGPAVRRGGTKYVAPVNSVGLGANKVWLSKFEFSNTQSFVLEWSHNLLRFYFNRGVLQSAGVDYTIVSPYAASDLTTSNGTFALDMVQSGDVVYIAHPSYPLKKLSRLSNTNWTITDVDFTNGPFKTMNTTKANTIYASGQTGSVTLTASTSTFTAAMVGQLIYLEPSDLSYIAPWYAGQEFAHPENPASPARYRRSNGKTYLCSDGWGGASGATKFVRCGGDVPIHTSGVQADGDGQPINGTNCEHSGISWQYVDQGRGVLKITGYTSATQVTATVQGNDPLPSAFCNLTATGTTAAANAVITAISSTQRLCAGMVVTGSTIPANATIKSVDSLTQITLNTGVGVTVGAGTTLTFRQPTWRYAFGFFNATDGYPSKVAFFRERLALARGQTINFSCAGDFENFNKYDTAGQVVADRAIQITISSDQSNDIKWLAPSQALIIGTAGGEFTCSESSTTDAFAPNNVKIDQQTSDGSAATPPARVNFSTIFVQRSGKKIVESQFNIQQNGYLATDLTVLADHITKGGVYQIAWHREPYRVLWAVRTDGQLLGFTFNKEQDVTGWHRHIIGGSFGSGSAVVECVTTIPSPDGTRDDLWMIVKRTINGSTVRYVEYLNPEYAIGDTQASAFYVDGGLTYSGAAATTLSGLNHLEGQTVQVLVNGATHPNCVVTSGAISLQVAATAASVGLAYVSNIRTQRIEAGAADGTSQGKTKRINKCVIRLYNTLGCFIGTSSSNLTEIQFRTGSTPMDQAPPLFTGDKLVEFVGDYDFDGYIYIKQPYPLPMTVVALMPQLHTFDR